MKKHLAWITCLLALTSTPAIAAEKVGVLMIDSPIDHEHEDIRPFIDLDAVERYSILTGMNKLFTWKKFNDQKIRTIRRDLRNPNLSDELRSIDTLASSNSSAWDKKLVHLTLCLKSLFAPSWASRMRTLGTQLHGTHVAGLLVKDHTPDRVKLVNFPKLTSEDFDSLILNGLESFLSDFDTVFTQNLAMISQAIQDENIKIVNMAFIFSRNPEAEDEESKPLIEMSKANQYEAYQQLFFNNSNTIFVISAGNSSADLATEKGIQANLLAKTQAENVIFVASLDRKGKLAKFSNYGKSVVDIAAPGIDIVGPRTGGGYVSLGGTAASASLVSNRLALIRSLYPELDAKEAIRFLLDNHTKIHPGLMDRVIDNRVLSYYEP